jgi:glycosyltransferase involved in cell wall biosynthesis
MSLCVIITPVRNEGQHFEQTINSVVSQTLRPLAWIIVNDGSSDGTPQLIDAAAKQNPWIRAVHRADRGFRKQGGGVVEAFYDGFKLVQGLNWDFIAKLDGDLSFSDRYFESCISKFSADPQLGIGGGRIYCRINGVALEDSPGDPSFHVRGATKIYRRSTWEAIGGLLQAPGWDTLDEVKANMLGWKTYSFRDLQVLQLKATGSGDGLWKNWVKNGRANYITGYHPAFMLLKCAKRVFDPPYGLAALGLLTGFWSSYLKRIPQVQDPALIRYLRRQQVNRLLGKQSLWSQSPIVPVVPASQASPVGATNG